jgi:hypothetical protein
MWKAALPINKHRTGGFSMKRLPCFVFLAALALATAHPGSAASEYPASPKALMERYLQLDADAAGLSAATWPELGQYTAFPQAPKWDTFVIIDRYEIGKILEGHTRAQVRVTYSPVGQLSDKFTADSKPETVIFYLNKVQDQWKVDSPALMPHVSYVVMKKRLDQASAANPKSKKANDELLAQITAARGK